MGSRKTRAPAPAASSDGPSSSATFDFTDQDLVGNDAMKQRVLGIDGTLPFESPCVRTHQAEGPNETYWDYMRDAGLDPSNWAEHLAEWNPEILDPHRLSPGQQVVLCDPGLPGWSEEPPDYSEAIDSLLVGAAEGGLLGSHPAPYDATAAADAMSTGALEGALTGGIPPVSEPAPPSPSPDGNLGPLGRWCEPNDDWPGIARGLWRWGAPGCFPGGGMELKGHEPMTEEEIQRMRESIGNGFKRGGRALLEAPGDLWDAGGKTLDGMGSGLSKFGDAFVEHLTPF